jgi:hypothetical protein
MALPGLQSSGQGGAILSNTLNLTKVASTIAAALSILIGVNGATATSDTAATPTQPAGVDWAGFSQGQRTAILIAIVAGVALVYAADVLARAIATSGTAKSGMAVARTPRAVHLSQTGTDLAGLLLAVRPNDDAVLFFDPATKQTQWIAGTQVTFD